MKETMLEKGKTGARWDSAEVGCNGAVLFMCVDRGLRVEPSGYPAGFPVGRSPQPTAHSQFLNHIEGTNDVRTC